MPIVVRQAAILASNYCRQLKSNEMNVPDILGVEVITPDGRGSILSLHPRKVIVHLNKIECNQIMKGLKRNELHYAYDYGDVEIIKGQYCFDDKRINFQYKRVGGNEPPGIVEHTESVCSGKFPVEYENAIMIGAEYYRQYVLSVLKENYEASKTLTDEDKIRSAQDIVNETYEDLIAIFGG